MRQSLGHEFGHAVEAAKVRKQMKILIAFYEAQMERPLEPEELS